MENAVSAPTAHPDDSSAWHFGDPLAEQRAADTGVAVIDRGERAILALRGTEVLPWLHNLISQHVTSLAPGTATEALILDVRGHALHQFSVTHLADTVLLETDREHLEDLRRYLTQMVFWADVTLRDLSAEWTTLAVLGPQAPAALRSAGLPAPTEIGRVDATGQPTALPAPLPAGPATDKDTDVVTLPGLVRHSPHPTAHTYEVVLPRVRAAAVYAALREAGARSAGWWAWEALRVAAVHPRLGLDSDTKTLPHELRLIGAPAELGAVHLEKGCYRGQETVSRIANLGAPPRHLVLLHLDGSEDSRPAPGDPVTAAGRTVGRVGTVVDHWEQGVLALALIKRAIPAGTQVEAGPVAATIDPDTFPADPGVPAGRQAINRLRGR